MWVFAGGYFARIVGPARDTGLISGTCCKSLADLQRLRDSKEVRHEHRKGFEAVVGTVDEPGVLRVLRMAWQPTRTDTLFYSVDDPETGAIDVGNDTVMYTLPGGARRETWRIVEWSFDPFATEEQPQFRGAFPGLARLRRVHPARG